MGKKFLAAAHVLQAALQNTHIDVSLAGWPAAVATIAVSTAAVAIAAIFASGNAEGELIADKEALPEGKQQDGGDAPVEGSSSSSDDP